MGVCAAGRDVANAIDGAFGANDHAAEIDGTRLATMPNWLQCGRLDLWEQQAQECSVDEVMVRRACDSSAVAAETLSRGRSLRRGSRGATLPLGSRPSA